jgi:hypothetical protein
VTGGSGRPEGTRVSADNLCPGLSDRYRLGQPLLVAGLLERLDRQDNEGANSDDTMWMPQPRSQVCMAEASTPYKIGAMRRGYPAGYCPAR